MKRSQETQGIFDTLVGHLPQQHVARLGRLLGSLAYLLDGRHRRIANRNLQFTHPDWNGRPVHEVTKRVFQNMGITVLEVLQTAFSSREHILERVRIRGESNLLRAVNSPNGAIVISAHLGNWEMSLLFASCFVEKPIVAVARPIQSKLLNRLVNRTRTRFGNIILDKKGSLPKMARMLRQGKTLGILIDQNVARYEAVNVTFFGRTVSATPAAALLARRYGSPVLPAFCVRGPDEKLTLVVESPLEIQKTNDLRADAQANTQIMTEAIERAIKQYLDQWLWLHKRWKRHYPHLYPEDLARRRRRREKRRRRSRRA